MLFKFLYTCTSSDSNYQLSTAEIYSFLYFIFIIYISRSFVFDFVTSLEKVLRKHRVYKKLEVVDISLIFDDFF